MTSASNNFSYFPKNQLIKFSAVQPIPKWEGDIHCRRVMIDFERVTRFSCGCHSLNVRDLADLGAGSYIKNRPLSMSELQWHLYTVSQKNLCKIVFAITLSNFHRLW